MPEPGNVNPPQNPPVQAADGKGQTIPESVKTVLMVLLTLVFVGLYVGALFGRIPEENMPPDPTTLSRIESIIFVIIGYYFGRLPSQANEKVLKNEIDRQAGKSDQSENAKDVAQQDKAALQQKMHSAAALLSPSVVQGLVADAAGTQGFVSEPHDPKAAAAAALKVLTSH